MLTACFTSQAKNYYFSSSTGNDSYSSTQAQSQSTPWKSIAKLNSFFGSIVAGDNIYFKRGDTFFGTIVVSKSGTSSSLITIGAYGTGNKPVISGLTTLSSWSLVSNGIYQASAPAVKSSVNLVTLNGTPQAVGRYPNADATNGGYLTYESYSGTSSITDNQLTSSTNWTGAEVVIRKAHYAMERCKITSHSGSKITYGMTSSINPLNNTDPAPVKGNNGFGYFIQRDSRTLDKLGEWYFNNSTKKMQMYFGSASPSSYTVKVTVLDTLINIGTRNYINVNNIAFEGANAAAIYAANGGNLTVQACDINYGGGKGVLIFNCPNVLVDGVTTNNMLCGAIDVTSRKFGNATVRNCVVKNTAMIPGMGSFWDDNDYKAISVTVTSQALVEYNDIQNTGFIAIQFKGNDFTVKNNFISSYNIVKDDGGAIYTYQTGTDAAPGTVYTNRVIKENIVLNGVGAPNGTGGNLDVDGIFLDGRVTNVEILNNSLANIGVNGIYTNNAINVNIRGNTSFNNGRAFSLSRYTLGVYKNFTIKQNIFYPLTSTQTNFMYSDLGVNAPTSSSIQANVKKIGTIDSNYYTTPNGAGFDYYYSMTLGGTWIFPTAMSLASWKTYSGHDKASKAPAKTSTNVNDILFKYNASKSAVTIALDAKYVGVDGTVYNGSITLQPYTSKILVKDGTITGSSSSLKASATSASISCFGSTASISVSGSGGTAPYTGTGAYTVSAGKGTLKISVAKPVADASTFVYSTIGGISNTKNYVLRFSTLGTTASGSLKAYIRQTASPYTTLSSVQTKTFGTSRVDHQFIFTAPASQSAASFLIEVLQSSGTVYIDNIAFFEATTTGDLISANLYTSGQFESSISGVTTWSSSNNHVAALDVSSKITNTYYYPVKDAKGAISTTAITTTQPSALTAASTAGTITKTGGTTTVVVTATGGTAPYTGTGSFTGITAGTRSYTVKDAKGCTSVTTVVVKSSTASRTANTDTSGSVVGGADSASTSNSLVVEQSKLLKVSSYPNPTTTEFGLVVEGGTNEKVIITVLSVDGRIVYATQGTSNRRYAFGNNLMTGMYFVKVMQGKTMQTIKVVKEAF